MADLQKSVATMETLERTQPASRRKTRSDFFTFMAGAVLLVVIAGFIPTLYLRPLFAVPPIPAYLYLHGIILSTWFVWFFAQALLIRTGHIRRHRQFGAFGAGFGAVVVAGGLMASLGLASRAASSGIDFDADAAVLGIGVSGVTVTAFLARVVCTNLGSLLSFATLLAAAVIFRHRPQAHKRLMLLASISILGPALARIARLPGFGGEQGPFTPTVLWGLVLTLAIYDFLTRRRLHPATGLGMVFMVLITVGARIAGGTEAAQMMILQLR